MLINYNRGWTYEYTDADGNRFYRMWDRQNKQLHVLNLRHSKDDLMDTNHVNWEIWRSPSHCESESHAEDNLEYFDCGIYGSGFVSCLNDAMNPKAQIREGQYPYKLCKDPELV
ncbi:MAG: hypothetical protein CMA30_06365 [Euryarchaeota archaeon]|nr:hypothetical protein [Euryarchaeota archaeon]|tara:strand:- start:586 stop:927 length:342 start_codon:yes stop_codon:yes gene_type:complete